MNSTFVPHDPSALTTLSPYDQRIGWLLEEIQYLKDQNAPPMASKLLNPFKHELLIHPSVVLNRHNLLLETHFWQHHVWPYGLSVQIFFVSTHEWRQFRTVHCHSKKYSCALWRSSSRNANRSNFTLLERGSRHIEINVRSRRYWRLLMEEVETLQCAYWCTSRSQSLYQQNVSYSEQYASFGAAQDWHEHKSFHSPS